jgi:hypothetical protein
MPSHVVVVGQNLHININRVRARLVEIKIVSGSEESKYRTMIELHAIGVGVHACGYLCRLLGGVAMVMVMMDRRRRRQKGGGATIEEEVLVPAGGIAAGRGGELEEEDEDVGQEHGC